MAGKCISSNCDLLSGVNCLRCKKGYTISDSFECVISEGVDPEAPENPEVPENPSLPKDPVKQNGSETVFIVLFSITLVALVGLLCYVLIMKFRAPKTVSLQPELPIILREI